MLTYGSEGKSAAERVKEVSTDAERVDEVSLTTERFPDLRVPPGDLWILSVVFAEEALGNPKRFAEHERKASRAELIVTTVSDSFGIDICGLLFADLTPEDPACVLQVE